MPAPNQRGRTRSGCRRLGSPPRKARAPREHVTSGQPRRSRNAVAAWRPLSNNLSRVRSSRLKSVELTPDVSTWIVRRPAPSSANHERYQSLVSVWRQRTPILTGPPTGRSADHLGDELTLTPHVGQRGGRQSVRSNVVIGKLTRRPPSTQVTAPPSVRSLTGLK